MDSIRIATWNINGLYSNKEDVEIFLHEHKIDILLIFEAHCTNSSKIRIRGFSIYTTNHPDETAHAGTAIIIRDNIRHHLLPEYKTLAIQATTVAVEDKSGYFNVSAIYCPPRHKITDTMFTQLFNSMGNRFIAGGDWNSKHTSWGSRLTTPRGRQLKACITSNKLSVLSALGPTYWPTDLNKIPDLLDFFVVKGLSRHYMAPESCLDGSSDHTPVLLTDSTMVIEADKPEVISNSYTFGIYSRIISQKTLTLKWLLNVRRILRMPRKHLHHLSRRPVGNVHQLYNIENCLQIFH